MMESKIPDAVKKLLSAARNDHLDIVERMLKRGADVNAIDEYGRSALKYTARCSSIEVVKILLDAGAVTDVCDLRGMTVLSEAASLGRTDVIELLLDHGADVNFSNQYQYSSLMVAVRNHLSNWELPSPAVFSAFMELFYRACLEIRGLRSLRDHSVRPVSYYRLNPSRVATMEDEVIDSEVITRALASLPSTIVKWRSFDAIVLAESHNIARESNGLFWANHFDALEAAIRQASTHEMQDL